MSPSTYPWDSISSLVERSCLLPFLASSLWLLVKNLFSILKLLLLFHLLLLSLHDQIDFLLDPLQVVLMNVLLLVKVAYRRLLLVIVILSYQCVPLSALITLTPLTALATLVRIVLLICSLIPISHHLFSSQLFLDLLEKRVWLKILYLVGSNHDLVLTANLGVLLPFFHVWTIQRGAQGACAMRWRSHISNLHDIVGMKSSRSQLIALIWSSDLRMVLWWAPQPTLLARQLAWRAINTLSVWLKIRRHLIIKF